MDGINTDITHHQTRMVNNYIKLKKLRQELKICAVMQPCSCQSCTDKQNAMLSLVRLHGNESEQLADSQLYKAGIGRELLDVYLDVNSGGDYLLRFKYTSDPYTGCVTIKARSYELKDYESETILHRANNAFCAQIAGNDLEE